MGDHDAVHIDAGALDDEGLVMALVYHDGGTSILRRTDIDVGQRVLRRLARQEAAAEEAG